MKITIMETETFGKLLKNGCKAAVYAIVAITAFSLSKENIAKDSFNDKVGYDDAIDAILNSGMFSDDKMEAISAIGKKETEAIYRAIVHVANSSMFSDDKVKTIKDICTH